MWEKLSDAGYEAVNIEGGYRAYLRLLLLSHLWRMMLREQKELKTKEIEHSIIKIETERRFDGLQGFEL